MIHHEPKNLKPGFWLFLTCFLLYWAGSPGVLPNGARLHWAMAKQLVEHKSWTLPETWATDENTVQFNDSLYAIKSPGISIVLIPFAATTHMLAHTEGYSPQTADLTGQFLAATIFFPMIGALAAYLVYRLVLLLGYHLRTAIFLSILFAVGTFHWKYTLYMQEECLLALLLLAAITSMVKNQTKPAWFAAILLCLFVGLSLHITITAVVMAVPILLIAGIWEITARKDRPAFVGIIKWTTAAIVGLLPLLFLLGWYNHARFGCWFETGYGLLVNQKQSPFSSHALGASLAALLFSPAKSIFLYNPVLIAIPLCLITFARRHAPVFLVIALTFLANIIWCGLYRNWAGDPTWGTRYQAPLLGFLILPLVVGLERLVTTDTIKLRSFRLEKAMGRPPRCIRLFIYLLFLLSFPIQIASVVYDANLENSTISAESQDTPAPSLWNSQKSQLFLRTIHITRHVLRLPAFADKPFAQKTLDFISPYGQPEPDSKKLVLNFFPFQIESSLALEKTVDTESKSIDTELLISLLKIAWLTGLAGMFLTLLGLLHSYKKSLYLGGS